MSTTQWTVTHDVKNFVFRVTDRKLWGHIMYDPPNDGGGMSLESLYVCPEFRREGVATALMEEFLLTFGDEYDIDLLVVPSYGYGAMGYSQLRSFYARYGFHPIPGKCAEKMRRPASGIPDA